MNKTEVDATTERVKATLTRMVAKRAYEKWAGRGYQHGGDQRDWLEAEKEIISSPEAKMVYVEGNRLPIPENLTPAG